MVDSFRPGTAADLAELLSSDRVGSRDSGDKTAAEPQVPFGRVTESGTVTNVELAN